MTKALEALANMEYPGRFIIIGQNPQCDCVTVYGITGRSESSQARRLVHKEVKGEDVEPGESMQIAVEPTDEELIKKGNVDLLIYPAIIYSAEGIVVSNGKQTEDIWSLFIADDGVSYLSEVLENWEYEPDKPNYTPRISGIINEDNAVLSIIKRVPEEHKSINYFKIPLIPGKGSLIATYTGVNQNPLPSFKGEPLEVYLEWIDIEETAQAVWDALNPDFRVAVAAVQRDFNYPSDTLTGYNISIINRHGGN